MEVLPIFDSIVLPMKSLILFLCVCCSLQRTYAQLELRLDANFLVNIEALNENVFVNANVEGLANAIFILNPENSLGVGGGLGIYGEHPDYGNKYTFIFPLLVEYNYGYGSSSLSNKPIGVFANLGYQSIFYINAATLNGFVFSAGIRTPNFLPENMRWYKLDDIQKQLFIRVMALDGSTQQRIVSCGIGFNFPNVAI